ncbi:Uncharacterised protein [Halioglobus japonicus]|nr:Uncharacterised protein [Halioglobus japonicus]
MGKHASAALPHPDSGYSSNFTAYIQYLRTHHLLFFEPTIFLEKVETQENECPPSSNETTVSEDYPTVESLTLRTPIQICTQIEYWSPPGFILLDGLLYNSTSLEVLER